MEVFKVLLMKDIVDDSHKILREKSVEVNLPLSKEDYDLLMLMYEYLENSQNDEIAEKYDLRPAVGIAAVQVGVLKRMCAILIQDYDENGNVTKKEAYALANPKIVSYTPKLAYLKAGEGCLSVNDVHEGYVHRHAKVTIKGFDALTNQNVTIVARGYNAIVYQHELDHFDGKIFYDYINKDHPFMAQPNAMEIE